MNSEDTNNRKTLGKWLKRNILVLWRFYSVGIVLIMGTYCTYLTGIDGYHQPGDLLYSFYHTLKLFFFGFEGLPGTDPLWAAVVLYVLYLFAPFIIINSAYGHLKDLWYKPGSPSKKKLTDHIVIAGTGKMGEAIYDYFVKVKGIDNKKILAVDSDEKSTLILRLKSELKRFVIGDISSAETLERCNISEAKLFLALTGNDITNYDAARLVNDLSNRKCNSLVQISDPKLYELFKGNKMKHPEDLKKIFVINTYRMVAHRVLDKLLDKIKSDDQQAGQNQFSDIKVVIAGFGKFGRMFADILFEKAIETTKMLEKNEEKKLILPVGSGPVDIDKTKGIEVIVIDKNPDVKAEWKSYCSISKHFDNNDKYNDHSASGEAKYDYSLIEKNLYFKISKIRNTKEWEDIKEESTGKKSKPIYVILATDNDFSNVSTSLYLSSEFKDKVLVITRLFKNVKSLEEKKSTIESIVFSELANQLLRNKISEIEKGDTDNK